MLVTFKTERVTDEELQLVGTGRTKENERFLSLVNEPKLFQLFTKYHGFSLRPAFMND